MARHERRGAPKAEGLKGNAGPRLARAAPQGQHGPEGRALRTFAPSHRGFEKSIGPVLTSGKRTTDPAPVSAMTPLTQPAIRRRDDHLHSASSATHCRFAPSRRRGRHGPARCTRRPCGILCRRPPNGIGAPARAPRHGRSRAALVRRRAAGRDDRGQRGRWLRGKDVPACSCRRSREPRCRTGGCADPRRTRSGHRRPRPPPGCR